MAAVSFTISFVSASVESERGRSGSNFVNQQQYFPLKSHIPLSFKAKWFFLFRPKLAVKCGALSVPSRSNVTPPRCTQLDSNVFGDKCVMTCKDGYVMDDIQHGTLTCSKSGRWEGNMGTCNRKYRKSCASWYIQSSAFLLTTFSKLGSIEVRKRAEIFPM